MWNYQTGWWDSVSLWSNTTQIPTLQIKYGELSGEVSTEVLRADWALSSVLPSSVGLSAMCNKWSPERLWLFSTHLDQTRGAQPAPPSAADSNCPSAWATHQIMLASIVTRIWLQDRVFHLRVYYRTLLSEVFTIQEASGLKSVIKNITLNMVFSCLGFILCDDRIWTSCEHAFIILCVCFLILGIKNRASLCANMAAQWRTQSSSSTHPGPPPAPAQMMLQLFNQRTLRVHNNTSRKWRG